MKNLNPVMPLNRLVIACALTALLSACSPGNQGFDGGGITYPSDAQITSALQQQFAGDANSASARELVKTLGGEKGELRYRIQRVVYRQGAFEAHYDAVLHLGQPGAQSLTALYASMIPESDRLQLKAQTLDAYEAWLKQQAASVEKSAPDQARALTRTVDVLGKCYRDAPAGTDVVVMQGLAALLSPERKGLYAEKLASDRAAILCLPT
ncbi:MAG: hypothetical protein EOO27_26260 [Comamonadaceae bacterium]|nr:MAG: hypothetical protein EOO27_26260 [Comamonadaceae bacterium]